MLIGWEGNVPKYEKNFFTEQIALEIIPFLSYRVGYTKENYQCAVAEAIDGYTTRMEEKNKVRPGANRYISAVVAAAVGRGLKNGNARKNLFFMSRREIAEQRKRVKLKRGRA